MYIVKRRDLVKITPYEWPELYTEQPIEIVVKWVRSQDSIYLAKWGKLIKTSSIKLVEVATPVEQFIYFDLPNIPAQTARLMQDKINQAKEAGTADKITPETLTQWMETIREYLAYYDEAQKDTSPEAIATRKKLIQETRDRLAKKLSMNKWISTPS